MLDPISITVLYEDNHYIAVYKPANIPTQGSSAKEKDLLNYVKDYLKVKYQKPGNVFLGLVHRLDKPVEGIVVFAKTSKGASRISELIRKREVEKVYWARVEGCLQQKDYVELNHHLTHREQKTIVVKPGTEASQPASLLFKTRSCSEKTTLIEVKLITGRKHQIRAQLSHIGHPIVGDSLYGSHTRSSSISLCAKEFSFIHPTHSKKVTILAPEPQWSKAN